MACVLLALAGMLMPVGSSASDGFADESRNTVRILEGDNSDPSIVRHGDAYYLVHSSFVYTPGLVVYKSYDLVNWTYCSTALNHFAGDVWAPDIVVHNGRFYIYFPTLSSHGKTSMVTWADSPEGPWSEPVDLNVGGIDPEHVVDGDGRRWLLMSSGDMYPLTADGCKISGKPVSVYKGWPIPEDWDIESFSMEGLNVKKVGDYYYMFAAGYTAKSARNQKWNGGSGGSGGRRGRGKRTALKVPTPKAPEIIIPRSGTASSAKAGGTSKTPKVSGNVIADFTKTASGTDIQKAVTQAKRKALKAGNRTVYVEEGSPIDYFLKYGKLPSLK